MRAMKRRKKEHPYKLDGCGLDIHDISLLISLLSVIVSIIAICITSA